MLTPHPVLAEDDEASVEEASEAQEQRSIIIDLLLYVPNRVLDLVDIVRIRGRVGPGIGLSVRATEYVDLYAGSYIAFFGGFPGPRQSPTLPIPVGIESVTGIEVSVLDLTIDTVFAPNYSDSEFGVGLHLAVIGLDVGIDPVEIADFVSGIIGIDIREDDL